VQGKYTAEHNNLHYAINYIQLPYEHYTLSQSGTEAILSRMKVLSVTHTGVENNLAIIVPATKTMSTVDTRATWRPANTTIHTKAVSVDQQLTTQNSLVHSAMLATSGGMILRSVEHIAPLYL